MESDLRYHSNYDVNWFDKRLTEYTQKKIRVE